MCSRLDLLSLLIALATFCANILPSLSQWPSGGTTRIYDFKVQSIRITKLCNEKDIVTVNGMFPGPTIYAQEDDRIIVKVTNQTPYNASIHWHGVRQKLSCWYDGPAYITQYPIQPNQSFTYNFVLQQQTGTLFWHAHVSWLRATVHGPIVIYPKFGFPNTFQTPFEEQILLLGEYWLQDLPELENRVLESGGPPPPADAFTINGQPGPNYNCSVDDVFRMNVVPGKIYLLRIINVALNMESFFSVANHKLTILEADGEYTKPFTMEVLMLGPGQTMNVQVTADQPIGKYSMAMGVYMSAKGVVFQSTPAIAYLQYIGASVNSVALPANLPSSNDNLVVNSIMEGLRNLNPVDLPPEVDSDLFFTVGLNVQGCKSNDPKENCQGPNSGVMAASMNNMTFIKPNVSILEAYYNKMDGYYTEDFPGVPLKSYDFVNGAPNKIPTDTQSVSGSRTMVLEYGTRVQIILQDTGTVSTENHPLHLHGYSFYVLGYGTGNYDPQTAKFNLVDPPYMNTVGVPVGGWTAIRFTADNPGVWFMHCHLEIHLSWGLSMVFIVKNGNGPTETLPDPPADFPRC